MYADPTTADVPPLLEAHSNANPRMRQLAVRALGHVAVDDDAVVNALVDSISDANHVVRMEAMSAVPRFGEKSAKAVSALVDALRDKSFGFMAADALGDIGPNAKPAVPSLRALLPTAKGYDKLCISEALWKIEGDPQLVVPSLIELLHDDFGPIRRDAASILGRIGPPAKAAVPVLIETVQHVPAPQPPKDQADSNRFQPENAATRPGMPVGITREMTEEEFYPQIRAAATEALREIDPKVAAITRK
jgi:HEAT repeat protein